MKKLNKIIRHPIRSYASFIKHHIVPKLYSHKITMQIPIKKGQQQGEALIPCTIYALDHSIDLNPALIRKKDKKLMKDFDAEENWKYVATHKKGIKVNKKDKTVYYNENDFSLKLKDEEKERYELEELERCTMCKQKLVIAEVKATRYRSCPVVKVKLGDKAKEDVIIPVEYGVNKKDITIRYFTTPIFIFVAIFVTSVLLFNYDFLAIFLKQTIPSITISSKVIMGIKLFFIGFLWLYFIPVILYSTYKLFKWYYSVKDTMVKTYYKR